MNVTEQTELVDKLRQLWSGGGGADLLVADLYSSLRDESIYMGASEGDWLEVSVCFSEETIGSHTRKMRPAQIAHEWEYLLTPAQIVRLATVKTSGVAIVHDWGISLFEPVTAVE